MKLFKYLEAFKNDESGAVTVDWVVLTAAIVGLGIAVLTAVSTQVGVVTDAIEADLARAPGVGDAAEAAAAGAAAP